MNKNLWNLRCYLAVELWQRKSQRIEIITMRRKAEAQSQVIATSGFGAFIHPSLGDQAIFDPEATETVAHFRRVSLSLFSGAATG
ncbi:MAG: hypothetical protein ACRD2B_09595 [Terriglobia bacterium]